MVNLKRNLEDQIIGGKNLYSIEEQCLRIKAAREAAEHASQVLRLS